MSEHEHIAIEGNLPETFRFKLLPAPTLADIDAVPDGSDMILVAWSPEFPPPTIEGFDMTPAWKEFARTRIADLAPSDLPDEDVAFGNLFLFVLPSEPNPEDLPTEADIIEAIITRDEYTLDEVHILVREAVRRARDGMVAKPF